MADKDEKPSTATSPVVSVSELLKIIQDQAFAANMREEAAVRREERLASMLSDMHALAAERVTGSTTPDAAVTLNSAARQSADSARPPLVSVGPGPSLQEGISLQEFGTWETRLRAHAQRARWDQLSVEDQTASVLALLDDYWTRALQHGLEIALPNTYGNIVAAFQKHLRRQRSIVLDRREFFTRQQEAGESFDDYLIALKELAQFCDFCTQCFDEQFRDRIVNGVRDQEALQAMLAEPDLTLDKAIKLCRVSESARSNAAALHPATVQPVSAYRRSRSVRHPSPAAGRGSRRRSSTDSESTRGSRSPAARGYSPSGGWRSRPRDQRRDSARGDDACSCCGRRRHRSGETCPASRAACFGCGADGHFARVCPRAERRGVGAAGRGSSQSASRRRSVLPVVADVRLRSSSARRSPKVRIETRHGGGLRSIWWTPDTGAEVSCMGLSQAEQLGVSFSTLPAPTEKFYAANGQEL